MTLLRLPDIAMDDVDERIEIVAYDARWPAWFDEDARELRDALGDSLDRLEHFGSTAVPNLASKPIIDILIAPVSWPLELDDRAVFGRLGYRHLGEAGVPGREYFRRRASHATNVAVVQGDSTLWRDNLTIRDYLIAHPSVARAYGDAKRAAWTSGARTLLAYSRAKHDFVANLLAMALAWRTGTQC